MFTQTELLSEFEKLAYLLRQKHMMMATAESCTGGWVAKAATDLTGSSDWFECGLVTYSNRAKQQLLGVDHHILEIHGAVSQPTVEAMVVGLLKHCDADVGVSISGIAGPGGGTAEKPVGTVWMAWLKKDAVVTSRRFQFDGDRQQVRLQAVMAAVQGLIDVVDAEH